MEKVKSFEEFKIIMPGNNHPDARVLIAETTSSQNSKPVMDAFIDEDDFIRQATSSVKAIINDAIEIGYVKDIRIKISIEYTQEKRP